MAPRRSRARRFLRWYRVLPIVALALVLGVCGILAATPTSLARQLFYPVEHADAIVASCERHGVDPDLACAVIRCESGWDEDAVSAAGAVGLMQVMPETAASLNSLGIVSKEEYDPVNLAVPEVNIEYGCAYLGYLQDHLSNVSEIVAAYNAGIGTVQGWLSGGGNISEEIEYTETRVYLERVRLAYEGYQRSYPDGITGA